MLTRPQRHFHLHTVSRTIHQLSTEHVPATHEVSDNFRHNTLLVSLPSLSCNEWGHLNRIYDIFKTWLLRIWELFIRLKHNLSYSKCSFGGNKWFCCSFSNELLFIHSSNKQFVCMYVYATAVIKGNVAQVTTHNQVFFIMHCARYGCKCVFYYTATLAETKTALFIHTHDWDTEVLKEIYVRFLFA